MRAIGDLATEAALKLQAEHQAGIREAVIEIDDTKEVFQQEGRDLMSRIRFQWRDSDKLFIEQIKAAADAAFINLFEDCIELLDRLYSTVRVPKTNEHGVVMTDGQGRYIWERDEALDKPKEDWSRITGQDIDTILGHIHELRFSLEIQVNRLLMEAIMAKHIHDDIHADAYLAVVDGTINDRTARANRAARQDKYVAFYRLWIWSESNEFMKELTNFQKLLRDMREWGVRSQPR
jgi:hypothetical protein